MPAPGGEAAQRQGALQGVTIQEQGDSEATTETDGLCSYQTSSADVPRQVQRDPEDGSGPLQGQVNRQQACHLVSLGQGGRTLVEEPRRQGLQLVSEEYFSLAVPEVGHRHDGCYHRLSVQRQGDVRGPGQQRRQAANCPQQSGWAQDTKECYGLGFRYWTQYYRRNQMDESVPSAVNLFQLPAVQAAFAATATQEDSLLGGGSLLQEACGPLQHADSAGLLGYDVQGAADRNIKTLGSLGVQRVM